MSKIQILVVQPHEARPGFREFFLIVQDGWVQFPQDLFREKYAKHLVPVLHHSGMTEFTYTGHWMYLIDMSRREIRKSSKTGSRPFPFGCRRMYLCELDQADPQNEFSRLILEHARMLDLAD